MDWKEYEQEIAAYFAEEYPTARLVPNAKVLGRFSKVERQIDLLIEEQASDFAFRVVVDAKHRGRKLDVLTSRHSWGSYVTQTRIQA